ncbi:bifunctional nuclease family protein [Rhabdothermincola sediminis]|uniref:bifunctional nuclease family protein n=1 Tax=Rhabdothermincola sediminis TaxID=2751370 RepID=UPI001AA00DF2|nr:bifunctional nuclease family protein [Rhabdothermincola sediminis]
MIEMELVAVRIELPGNTPVVLLRELAEERRILPIFIGQPEATAIAFAIDGVVTPRPMTHDLMKDLLDELGATVERVVITELSEGTFFAEIHLSVGAAAHQVSSRPSDAIALALRAGCPIFAEEAVLSEAGLVEESEQESEEVVEKFREFIESVNPDDFAS